MSLIANRRALLKAKSVISTGGAASVAFIFAESKDIAFAGGYTSASQTWSAGNAVVFFFDDQHRGGYTVLINGASATQIGVASPSGRGTLWKATVSSGSGTVQISGAAAFGCIYCSAYVITSSSSSPSATPSVNDMAIAVEPQSCPSGTVPSNGVGIAFAAAANGPSTPSPATWTGGIARDIGSEQFVTTGNSDEGVSGHTSTAGTTTPTVATNNSGFNNAGATGAITYITWGP